MIDGALVLLALNEVIVTWILYDLLNPASMCWDEMLDFANETLMEFDKQIMLQFRHTNQRLYGLEVLFLDHETSILCTNSST